MSDCSTLLVPPYGTYVRLVFDKNSTGERNILIDSFNFRAGSTGRLKYLGWDKSIVSDRAARTSQYSSQGRSWPTGTSYDTPLKWMGLLVLDHPKWEGLSDIYTLQQASMKPGQVEKDVLLYDHRLMHKEATPIEHPEFDSLGAMVRSGLREYWALFRTEMVKLDLVDMHKVPETDEFEYLVDIELKERIPALAALP